MPQTYQAQAADATFLEPRDVGDFINIDRSMTGDFVPQPPATHGLALRAKEGGFGMGLPMPDKTHILIA